MRIWNMTLCAIAVLWTYNGFSFDWIRNWFIGKTQEQKLQEAIRNKDFWIITDYIIKNTQNPNPIINHDINSTLLHELSEYQFEHHQDKETAKDQVTRILKINSNAVHATNIHGDTPLHNAAQAGNDKIVDVLLSYGANPQNENYKNKTPIELALENDKTQVVTNIGLRHLYPYIYYLESQMRT